MADERKKGFVQPIQVPKITTADYITALEENLEEDTQVAVKDTLDAEKADSNPGSLKRSFLDSISSMFANSSATEALVGGLVATAFGGVEAGAEGFKIGQEFGKQRIDQRNKNLELDLKKRKVDQTALTQNKLRVSPSMITYDENGQARPVSYDSRGRFFLDGVEIPASKVVSITATEAGRKQVQGDKRAAQADIRLEQAYTRENRLERQFGDKQDEDRTKKFQTAVKSVEGNKVYQEAEKAVSEVATIKSLLDDAYVKGGQSLAMLGPRIAKGIAGEVGVLTEQDVTRYVKNPALVGGIVDSFKKVTQGKISAVSKDNLSRLLDVMEQMNKDKMDSIINRKVEVHSKTTKDFTKEELKDVLTINRDEKTSNDTIIRKDPKTGRSVIYDAKTKKPLRWAD